MSDQSENVTGGPAFPVMAFTESTGLSYYHRQGMTLQDYFAAEAMKSLVIRAQLKKSNWPKIADTAYEIADAMIARRRRS